MCACTYVLGELPGDVYANKANGPHTMTKFNIWVSTFAPLFQECSLGRGPGIFHFIVHAPVREYIKTDGGTVTQPALCLFSVSDPSTAKYILLLYHASPH